MSKAVKLSDIASRVGVSNVTVSKALSDQKGVSDEMRARIKTIAAELGYKQPSQVRKEASIKSYNFGVIIHEMYLDKYDSFYLQMYQQTALRAVSNECFTIMEAISSQYESELVLPKVIKEQKVDGLIIIGRMNNKYLDFLYETIKIPMVFMDFCIDRYNIDSFISDSYYGAYIMTNYLYEMGHRKIAYVGTVNSTGSITDRFYGYRKSLLEHNIEFNPDYVIDDRDFITGKVDESLIKLPNDMPTAFFCNCDLTASTLIHKFQNMGLNVPGDVSVVGYDNYLFPGLCNVSITTYEVDMREMAKRTISTLIKKLSGDVYRHGISIVEGHMVIKDSVRKIN